MTSILLATDLTPQSDRAFERALRLAGPADALTVLHTIDGDSHVAGAAAACRKAEEQLRAVLRAQGGDRPASVVVRLGEPAEEIVRQALRSRADLVVLGAHRRSLLGDMFGTATAQRIIDAGVAPVLAVQDAVTADYGRILVGMDASEASGRALAVALDAFPNAGVAVVHAFHVPFGGFLDSPANRRDFGDQHEREMTALIRDVGARTGRPDLAGRIELRLRNGMAAAVLQDEVREDGADLLVVGTSGSGNSLFGGVAATIVGAPPCDLMVVPPVVGPAAETPE